MIKKCMYALNRTLVINMDEKGFKTSMERSGLAKRTMIKYVLSVNMFNDWLFKHQGKRFENANESDIKLWASYMQKKEKRITGYFYGLKKYYQYKRNGDMVKTINEIISKLPLPKSTLKPLIRWPDFRELMSKAERISISDRNRALLELLWSEMNSNEILDLCACDINFEKRLITSRISGKTHHVTQEAWDALDKHIPIQDRDNGKPLFSINRRQFWQITKKYSKSVLTPKSFMSSCRDDLISAGKTIRFVTESEKKTREKEGKIEKSSIKKNLFDELVQEIKRFGARTEIQERIKKIRGEKEFQTLFEGYLLATFSDQRIIRESQFKGWKTGPSYIDFVVGKDQRIPIEVKLAQKDIGDHLRKGPGQVKEFLKYSGTRKGILVIVDQERDPERQKHSGMQDSVYIIVI